MNRNQTMTLATVICHSLMAFSTTAATKTGYFIDAPVTGLYYQTDSNISGTTVKGAYQYNPGDVVTFYLGNDDSAMPLARVSAQQVVTPTVASATPSRSINMTRLLLSLDSSPENSEEIVLASKALSDPSFQKQLKSVNLDHLDTYSDSLGIELVSVAEAAEHLNQSQHYIKDNFVSPSIVFEPLNQRLSTVIVTRRGWQGNLCFYDLARIDEAGYHGPIGGINFKLTDDGLFTYPSAGDYFGTEEPDALVSGCNLNSAYTYTSTEFEAISDYEEWDGMFACAKTGCTRNDLNGFNVVNYNDDGDWKYRTVAMNYDEETELLLEKTQGLGPSEKIAHLNRKEYLWLTSSNPKLLGISMSGYWQLVDYQADADRSFQCLLIKNGKVKRLPEQQEFCPDQEQLYTHDVTHEFVDMWWLRDGDSASVAQLNTPVKWYKDGLPQHTTWEYLPAGTEWDQGLLYRFTQKVTVDSNGVQQLETLGVAELSKVSQLGTKDELIN